MIDENGGSERGGLARDLGLMLLAGVVLGLLYNFIGLGSQPAWGLDWIADLNSLKTR